MERRVAGVLTVAVHLGALVPAGIVIWGLISGNLTANPVQAIQLRTGKTAINFLLLSLACTPFYLLTGFRPAMPLRRLLGMYAFAYAGIHFLNFVGVDYGFNLGLIRADALVSKRFIVAGLGALLFLIPLAVTSFGGLRSRVGRASWLLALLTYVAAILAVVHYIWQTKIDFRLPVLYAAILVFLLVFRIPPLRHYLSLRLEKSRAAGA
jgi:sulfoxide reductase heme-binding subunit YedZ